MYFTETLTNVVSLILTIALAADSTTAAAAALAVIQSDLN